jgi:predicted outer membrane protein
MQHAHRTVTGVMLALMVGAAVAGAQSGIRISKDPPPVPAGTRTTLAPVTAPMTGYAAGDLDIFGMMGDAHIAHHMVVGDSMEIEMARLVASRSQNMAVRDFAAMLAVDHDEHMRTTLRLIETENLGRQAHPQDPSHHHMSAMMNELNNMAAGPEFDRAFMRHQVHHHVNAIQAMRAMRPAARDDELETWIDRTIPVLERHLARAREVAAQIGATVDMGGGHAGHTPPPQR